MDPSFPGHRIPSQSENKSTPTSYVDDDDSDFSDSILRYIDQMLMEEDVDEQTHMLQESLAFRAKERSFYEVIGQKYPQQESGLVISNHDVLAQEEDEFEEEGRSKKLPAVRAESSGGPTDELDNVLLSTIGNLEKKHEEANFLNEERVISMGCKKKELTDLRGLLMDCAKSIAAGDPRAANDCLTKIRRHSSIYGDGYERLAHYFADGLEARLAGTGSHMYEAVANKRITAKEYMKGFQTCLASCPFNNASIFISNRVIAVKSEKAMRVHVIDFGILYGFQWPAFIQSLSEREGGPPRLRITGVDFPRPGFCPAERVEETGRRLARYAKTFNVPFEYNAIAVQDWGTIRIEDLKLEEGEFVAVNCLHRAQNLRDEMGLEESPRTMFLNLIRSISPDIFVHVTDNGAYSLPSFVSRFREALYHFSALYDMVENTIPRESRGRFIIEGFIFGKEALNVIACEEWKRVERPEVYMKWQVRHLKAGFVNIHLERKMVNDVKRKVRRSYHKEFSVCEDNQWLLMSWKGRTMYALSCWQPASSC